jgi:hypothetical protein
MNKLAGIIFALLLFAVPASAEIRSIDVTVFGMD